MSNDRSTSPISVPQSSSRPRRASLASGLGFSDYISKPAAQPPANPGRRLSITTLGLSGSPTQTSPFAGRNFRHGSISSSMGSNSANVEEAVAEDGESGPSGASSPFARRVSFGAQALRDARAGSLSNGRYPSPGSPVSGARRNASSISSSSSPYTPTTPLAASTKAVSQNDRSNPSWRPLGEGFNWTEALRSRAERAPSLGNISPNAPPGHHAAAMSPSGHHQRAASIATMEQPSREMPKQPKQNKPDFFQEKILRGDFMD
ncbi:hypothetical protein ATEIFO6365_0006006400 [Aspergillus terreus]|uniref:Uncharacterized protein n=1 Tax=Aspergillus terreus TaxID=33178 RepID=A0A5M3YVT4_ASPTE|nr:hypothetical protein ATETN484_0005006200 [Aspergillus terreus]GFF16727.1 hypothetical protein ATEIFO6365_0006006400 [Aspergillus terreus]